jgi:hypothetical protein
MVDLNFIIIFFTFNVKILGLSRNFRGTHQIGV